VELGSVELEGVEEGEEGGEGGVEGECGSERLHKLGEHIPSKT
jgi:hypothetical protein